MSTRSSARSSSVFIAGAVVALLLGTGTAFAASSTNTAANGPALPDYTPAQRCHCG